jgi:hypothetical protein
MARHHFADMKTKHGRNGLQILFGAGNEFLRRTRFIVLRPKYDYVRKHGGKIVAPFQTCKETIQNPWSCLHGVIVFRLFANR